MIKRFGVFKCLGIVFLLCWFYIIGCTSKGPSRTDTFNDKSAKYALFVLTKTDTNKILHPDIDPIDVNAVWLHFTRTYSILIEHGYKDENIRILYGAEGMTPDFSEPENQEISKRIKQRHFSNQYPNEATKSNILVNIEYFKDRVGTNNHFIFYVGANGNRGGTLIVAGRRRWSPPEIQRSLKGFKSNHCLFIFESCYSGAILRYTNFDNALCFASTSAVTLGWTDRNFSGSAFFIKAKTDKRLDKNKDKIVDYDEALDWVKERAEDYWPKLENYVLTRYILPKRLRIHDELKTKKAKLKQTSIIPLIKAGENYIRGDL